LFYHLDSINVIRPSKRDTILRDTVRDTPMGYPHFPHKTIGVYIYRVIYKAGFFVYKRDTHIVGQFFGISPTAGFFVYRHLGLLLCNIG